MSSTDDYERRLARIDPRDLDAVAADFRAVGDDLRTVLGVPRQAAPISDRERSLRLRLWHVCLAVFATLVFALSLVVMAAMLT